MTLTGWQGPDINPNYWGKIEGRGNKMTVAVTAHAAWKLDVTMYQYYGVHLSPEAFQVLNNDAATIPC